MDRTVSESKTVVVFGKKNGSALDIVRCLGQEKYEIILVLVCNNKSDFDVAATSKYVSKSIQIGKDNRGKELVVLQNLAQEIEDKAVFFPVDDYAMLFLDTFFNELNEIFTLMLKEGQKKGDISSLLNKGIQSDYARKAGLLTPKEIEIDLEGEINLPRGISYPVYCKTVSSVEGSKQDQKRCNNSEDLMNHLHTLKKNNPNRIILIQEFLNIEEEYIILGACTNAQPIIIGIVRKIVCTQYTSGLVVLGTIEELDKVSGFTGIRDNIISFLNSIPYVGLFDFEFNRANGQLYFNEFNLRASGLGYCMNKAGVNLPAALVGSYLNYTSGSKDYGTIEYGRIFIKEKNAFKDYYAHNISLVDLIRLFKRADDTLISDKLDRKPGLVFYLHAWKKALRKRGKPAGERD